MLNEEKISLMTKLALYEQKEGKKDIPMSGYYKGDYVSLKVMNSAIIATVAYILVIGSLILINAEELLNRLTEIDLIAEGRRILIYYIGFLLLYCIIAYIVYSIRFKYVRVKLNQYNADLKKLYEIYKNEKKNNDVSTKTGTHARRVKRVRKEEPETVEVEEKVEITEKSEDEELNEILQIIEE